MLGIIGAMADEVSQLKQEMSNVKIVQAAGMEFYQGTIGGKEAVVVRSGIGKVNAAMCVQILGRSVPGGRNCKYRNCGFPESRD